jgi:hypothetical protein
MPPIHQMYLTIHLLQPTIHQSKIQQLKQIPQCLQTITRTPQLPQIIIRALQIPLNKLNNKIITAPKIPPAPKPTALQQIKAM